MSGAKAFLPNKTNYITIKDLQHATRVEMVVEKLTSHGGTNNPRVQVNGGNWISIPEAPASQIPGKQGVKAPTILFLAMRYVHVKLPLNRIKQGSNSFKFTCQGKGGYDLGRVWPQFLYYGVTFRVYYDANKKGGPRGYVANPGWGGTLHEDPTFQAVVGGPNAIRQVDFIGDYDDFDWQGESRPTQWQYNTLYGKIRNHIGSATKSPWKAVWDTEWIPTQKRPFSVTARVTDSAGLIFMTPPVGDLRLARQRTVVRHTNYNISKKWQSQYYTPNGRCDTNVATKNGAKRARAFMATWNGVETQNLSLNGRKILSTIGKNHDLSYDSFAVPLNAVRSGRNYWTTRSTTKHHGVEVLWPGPELFLEFPTPETTSSLRTFGKGCSGVSMSLSGRALLGKPYTLQLRGAQANKPVVLLSGMSNFISGPFILPIPLDKAGARGCALYVSQDRLDAFSSGSGSLNVPITIPNHPSYYGFRLFHQFAVLDKSNALGGVLTNAAEAILAHR